MATSFFPCIKEDFSWRLIFSMHTYGGHGVGVLE